ncbi:MAG: hypothetical protein EA398_01525 [Deltaproteobacteria bacterium]|nr:MAG: hypothetical protein EA398_01525 [Deltaproteobacteria bacterium]
MSRKARERAVEEESVMGRDPLAADDEILARTFYGAPDREAEAKGQPVPTVVEEGEEAAAAPAPVPERRRRSRTKSGRRDSAPSHYRIVSISLYNEDIERIDSLVAELKARGHSKANRSALIRYAIDTIDIDGMPRSY